MSYRSSYKIGENITRNDACYGSLTRAHLSKAIVIEKYKLNELSDITSDDLMILLDDLTSWGIELKLEETDDDYIINLLQEGINKAFILFTGTVLRILYEGADEFVEGYPKSYSSHNTDHHFYVYRHYRTLKQLFPENDTLELLCMAYNFALGNEIGDAMYWASEHTLSDEYGAELITKDKLIPHLQKNNGLHSLFGTKGIKVYKNYKISAETEEQYQLIFNEVKQVEQLKDEKLQL